MVNVLQYFSTVLFACSFFKSMELLLSLSCLTISPLNLYKKYSCCCICIHILHTTTNIYDFLRGAQSTTILFPFFYSNTALSPPTNPRESEKLERGFHYLPINLARALFSLLTSHSLSHIPLNVYCTSLTLPLFSLPLLFRAVTYTVKLWPPPQLPLVS